MLVLGPGKTEMLVEIARTNVFGVVFSGEEARIFRCDRAVG